jgi:S-adenosylmethionine decarboxylase
MVIGRWPERRGPWLLPAGSALTEHAPLAHVSADLTGVGSGALRDAPLLSGLLIAAASAAGLNAAAAPVVRTGTGGGVSAVLLLDPCHVSVHSLPDRGLALVDVLAPDAVHAAKALDVFVRRLVPSNVKSETRMRG